MTIHFNVFNIALLFGTVQGVILSGILLFSRADRRQNRYFLAAFMLVLAYNSFGTFCWSSGLNTPWLGFFDSLLPYTFIFTVGPSFYLYIKTTIESQPIGAKTIFKTYLPGIADFIFRIGLLAYAVLNKNGALSAISAGKIDAIYDPLARMLMVIIFWCYLIAAIRIFRNRQQQSGSSSPVTEQIMAIKWTKVLLIAMTLIALVWTVTIFGSVIFNITGLAYFEPIEIILVIFVYWIGLKGYQQTRVVYINDQKAAKTYMDSFDPMEAEKCVRLLQDTMYADKLYLDPELTVTKLAAKTGLNPKIISTVLNRQLNKGFNEFVNEYRVSEVKAKMLQPANKHITIAGLALESGFNSVATFQRVFKLTEHMTPKEFISRNSKN